MQKGLTEQARNVIFFDVGHSKTTVAVCQFTSTLTRVVFSVSNRHLGARDFDLSVANKLVARFLEANSDSQNPMDIMISR